MSPELLQAVGVEILDTAHCQLREKIPGENGMHIHTPGTSRNSPALFETLELALARVLRLTFHEVVIVVLAPCANEIRGGKEGSRCSTEFLDFGDRIRERRGVVENLLVEAEYMQLAIGLQHLSVNTDGQFVVLTSSPAGGTYIGFRAAMMTVLADL